jgi:hypothetical protein
MRRLSSYRVFLTRQSEYHVRGHVCFGVRDRRSGRWLESHWALRARLASAFPDAQGNMCSIASPAIGEPLWFAVDGVLHHTSPVISVEEREHLALREGMGRLSPALRAELAHASPSAIRDTH